jgi:glucuronate isomerase
MARAEWYLPEDRYLDPDPAQRRIAREMYQAVASLPLVCPHGHVEPWLLGDPQASFGSPAELLVISDHYVFRMLYSQGIPLEALGVPRGRGEQDHRRIWQTFADHFYLFRGTPTGLWLAYVFRHVFGIRHKLTSETAQETYDHVAAALERPEFRPRALFDRFRIEVLCTTDFASDSLAHHHAIRASEWQGDVRPTFRADDVIHLCRPGWRENLDALAEVSGITIHSYARLIQALEQRRADFRALGATATDHDGTSYQTGTLPLDEAERIFQRALRGQATPQDASRFLGHMLMESARMSIEDGLVMQVHFGSYRNHNQPLFERYGPDMGGDIPMQAEFTHNLRPLLNTFGNDPRLTLVAFTLDESTYSRELAPLAGHYPALRLGPAWWFHDSINGMLRYRQRVTETAGLYNTVGFTDDTRSFPSIPARHDLARRVDANWLAGLVVRGIIDLEDAHEMILDTAYRLAKRTYKFDQARR